MYLGSKPVAQKPAKPVRDRLYMTKVKTLPCCICGCPGPSDAHHVICGRFGTLRVSDRCVIPLCEFHHRYPHPDAIHSGKASWVDKHGNDYEYIEATRRLVDAMDGEDEILTDWLNP